MIVTLSSVFINKNTDKIHHLAFQWTCLPPCTAFLDLPVLSWRRSWHFNSRKGKR